ncbi:MAG: hypothetical protein AAGF25_00480 [Pseudomonadota bacterium]
MNSNNTRFPAADSPSDHFRHRPTPSHFGATSRDNQATMPDSSNPNPENTGLKASDDSRPTINDSVATTTAPVATGRDMSAYTMTVLEAVGEFEQHGFPITERTVQRYCHKLKLDAIKVDPDSREPSTALPFMFLIDPASVTERLRVMREQRDNEDPQFIPVQKQQPAPVQAEKPVEPEPEPTTSAPKEQDGEDVRRLQEKINSLEVDKQVRDRMIEQLKDDRKEWFEEMGRFVDRVAAQAKEIGTLKAELRLQAPGADRDAELVDPEEGSNPHFGI